MLYLEDFLELIESLPSEVRDKCTSVRELDLSVENKVELLQKKMAASFEDETRPLGDPETPEDPKHRDGVLMEVEQGFRNALADASEKVSVVNQLFDLVERYSRRLDQDLNKFKIELEADNAGITQILEAKVSRQLAEEETTPRHTLLGPCLDMFAESPSSPVKSTKSSSSSKANRGVLSKSSKQGGRRNEPSEFADGFVKRESSTPLGGAETEGGFSFSDNVLDEKGHFSSSNGFFTPPTSPSDIKDFDLMSNHQGDRYSLPRSLDMLENVTGNIARNFSSAGSSNVVLKNRPKRQLSSSERRGAASSTYVPSRIDSSQYVLSPIVPGGAHKRKRRLEFSGSHPDSNLSGDDGAASATDDSAEIGVGDSSEQRWCVCNEFSYGNMIACDSDDCPIEWFHYPCVGIPASGISKKKWYCPDCRVKEKLKKKNTNSRKN